MSTRLWKLKKTLFGLSPLIQIQNNSYGIPRSRGHNFLFKNVDFFEIRQKFAEIGRFEFGISFQNRWFSRFPLNCLIFLYISFTNTKEIKQIKGNQENQRFRREIPNSNRPISAKFWRISKFSTFLKRKVCPLERRMPKLLFFFELPRNYGGTTVSQKK